MTGKNNFTSLQSGLSVLLCLLVALGGVQGYFVQFFEEVYFKGLLQEIEVSDDKCVDVNFPGGNRTIRSIKTDRCLMIYDTDTKNCSWDITVERIAGLSFRVEKDEQNLLPYYTHLQKSPFVKSFAPCHITSYGFGALGIDAFFIGGTSYLDFYIYKEAAMYQHVCGCPNIRHAYQWGKTRQIAVDNLGNTFEMFEGEHCTGKSKVLPAGYSPESNKLWPGKDFDVRSFRSANIYNCLKLEASISSFNFDSDKSTAGGIDPFTESAQLATSATMRNIKASKLTQEYSVSEKVSNTLDFTLAKGFNKMEKVGFTTDFKSTVSGGVEKVCEGKVGFSLSYSNFDSWSSTVTDTSKKVVTNEETVSTRQVIEVPSCKECVATSSLQKISGYPIAYTAYTRINGSDSKRRLEATELRTILPADMNYVKDFDEYTVEAVTKGIVTADFAWNAFINVDCVPIPGCNASG